MSASPGTGSSAPGPCFAPWRGTRAPMWTGPSSPSGAFQQPCASQLVWRPASDGRTWRGPGGRISMTRSANTHGSRPGLATGLASGRKPSWLCSGSQGDLRGYPSCSRTTSTSAWPASSAGPAIPRPAGTACADLGRPPWSPRLRPSWQCVSGVAGHQLGRPWDYAIPGPDWEIQLPALAPWQRPSCTRPDFKRLAACQFWLEGGLGARHQPGVDIAHILIVDSSSDGDSHSDAGDAEPMGPAGSFGGAASRP